MILKYCFKCGGKKPLNEFYEHPQMADGHLGKCKECTKSDVRSRYRKTRKARSEYEKKRNKDPERRKKMMAYRKAMRHRNPEKARAWSMVSNAIRSGRLIKKPCGSCGNQKAQAHHNDYSKPLDVVWRCFKCHREQEHGQIVVSECL